MSTCRHMWQDGCSGDLIGFRCLRCGAFVKMERTLTLSVTRPGRGVDIGDLHILRNLVEKMAKTGERL